MLELETYLEDPSDQSRIRFLSGKDPGLSELSSKLEEVIIDDKCVFASYSVCVCVCVCVCV